jgi:hypothetical protein
MRHTQGVYEEDPDTLKRQTKVSKGQINHLTWILLSGMLMSCASGSGSSSSSGSRAGPAAPRSLGNIFENRVARKPLTNMHWFSGKFYFQISRAIRSRSISMEKKKEKTAYTTIRTKVERYSPSAFRRELPLYMYVGIAGHSNPKRHLLLPRALLERDSRPRLGEMTPRDQDDILPTTYPQVALSGEPEPLVDVLHYEFSERSSNRRVLGLGRHRKGQNRASSPGARKGELCVVIRSASVRDK